MKSAFPRRTIPPDRIQQRTFGAGASGVVLWLASAIAPTTRAKIFGSISDVAT